MVSCTICFHTGWDLRDFRVSNVPKRCECFGGPKKLYEHLRNDSSVTRSQVESFAKYWSIKKEYVKPQTASFTPKTIIK